MRHAPQLTWSYYITRPTDIRATIGFREPSYTVVEGEGSVTVEVELRSGTIPAGNEVVVSFSTANQVATGGPVVTTGENLP